MTPAIKSAQRAKISFEIHKYDHDPAVESYGLEAAEKLSVAPEAVFKTLVVSLEGKQLAVAILPVTSQLDLKQFARAAGAKKAAMADPKTVERTTGYILGGVSPLGQKKRLPTVIDDSAAGLTTMYVSGGRRGLDIELAPDDLRQLTAASFAPISKR